MENHQNNCFRYEKKFVLTHIQFHLFISELYAKNFSEIFYKRKVNNIYFDTPSLSDVFDNVEGVSDRKKRRLRWYGETFGKSNKTYELKVKREFLNTKKTISIGTLSMEKYSDIDNIYSQVIGFLKDNHHFYFFQTLNNRKPVLVNSYQRRYFMNPHQEIRITIDSDLQYYSPITKIHNSELNIIIEVKFNKETEFENLFKNLYYSKNSKYVKGFLSTSVYHPQY